MLRVMSCNLRYGLAADGDNRWERRRHLALARIRAFLPDLLGLQECRDDDQAACIRAGLADCQFLGVHRQGPGDRHSKWRRWCSAPAASTCSLRAGSG